MQWIEKLEFLSIFGNQFLGANFWEPFLDLHVCRFFIECSWWQAHYCSFLKQYMLHYTVHTVHICICYSTCVTSVTTCVCDTMYCIQYYMYITCIYFFKSNWDWTRCENATSRTFFSVWELNVWPWEFRLALIELL